jgi:hypothetical protein
MFLYTPHQNIFKLFRKIQRYPWFANQTTGRGPKKSSIQTFFATDTDRANIGLYYILNEYLIVWKDSLLVDENQCK